MEGAYRYVLTDVERAIWTDTWQVDEETLPLGAGATWRVGKTTLRGGTQHGIDLIEVDNGAFSFFVVPTRGMGIWKGIYKGIPLGWESPVRDLVHPGLIDPNDRGGLGWLKGFNEWIVRCGLNSNGAPTNDVVIDNNGNEAEVFLPLHGNIANIPARQVEIRVQLTPPHAITVVGIVEETMMFGPALRLTTHIETALGSNEVTISDHVTNLSSDPSEMQLLYHCNYGPPLLEDGSMLVAPYKQVSPRDERAREGIGTFDRFQGPRSGFVEQVYFYELLGKRGSRETAVLLKNKEGNLGSTLQFSLKQMPSFSLWKNTSTMQNGYVTGLEPATNYPNPKPFERRNGRVPVLESGATHQTDLKITVHDSRKSVLESERQIRQIQRNGKPKVSEIPLSRLSG
jgi:hypothetical protein